jgi:hypothetical protein
MVSVKNITAILKGIAVCMKPDVSMWEVIIFDIVREDLPLS